MRERHGERLPARAIYELLTEATEVSASTHDRASALASGHQSSAAGERRLIAVAMNLGLWMLALESGQPRRHPFFDDLLFGIRTRADAANVDLLLLTGASSQVSAEATHYVDICRRHGAGAIILAAFVPEEPELAEIATSGFPTVAIDTPIFGARSGFIASDNVGGAAEAVRHLAGLRRERIAYLGGWGTEPADIDRRLGSESALGELGLELRAAYVGNAGWSHVRARNLTRRMLGLEQPPDAIFCASDVVAIGAIVALEEAGVRVPEDIAVVGFDDSEYAAICVPSLTSVRQDSVGLGTASVEAILRMLENPREPPPSSIFPFELVVRESTMGKMKAAKTAGGLPLSRLPASSLFDLLGRNLDPPPKKLGEKTGPQSKTARPQEWRPEKRRLVAIALDTSPDQSFRHAFFDELFVDLRALAYAHDIDLLVITGVGTRPGEPLPPFLQLCERYRADGLMVMSLAVEELSVAELARSTFPCVTFDVDLLNDRIAFVMSDNIGGAVKITRHLIETGRRRIAFIGGRGDERPTVDRRFGYQGELERWGLTVPPEYLAMARWLPNLAYEATERLLALPEPPDAIFCASDVMGLAAIAAVESSGLHVPEDVAIAGFDDIDYARLASPSLTTVRQSRDALAHGMMAAMLALLEHPGEPPSAAVVPVELIVRESTAITVTSEQGDNEPEHV